MDYRTDYCIICGSPATDGHHIIPRGHIGGRAAENWPANIAPLCHPCHMRIHAEGLRRALEHAGIELGGDEYDPLRMLWSRMEYTPVELAVLGALDWHRKAKMYPLVLVRADWARSVWDGIPPQVRKEWLDATIDGVWEPLIGKIAGPVPGWVKTQ